MIVVVTALAVLTIGLASNTRRGTLRRNRRAGLLFAIADLVLTAGESNSLSRHARDHAAVHAFQNHLPHPCFLHVILARGDHSLQNHGEYLALILLATIGLMLLVGSEELLMIFIGLELTRAFTLRSDCVRQEQRPLRRSRAEIFPLRQHRQRVHAFGLSFIYGMTGTTALAAVAGKISSQDASPLLAAGIIMTLIGFAFKIAAAPFHLWAPDAYEGAPVPSAAFIASGFKSRVIRCSWKNRARRVCAGTSAARPGTQWLQDGRRFWRSSRHFRS